MHKAAFKPLGEESLECVDCGAVVDRSELAFHACRRKTDNNLPIIGQAVRRDNCVHRGQQVGSVGCVSCAEAGSHVQLKVFSCTEFHQCTIGKKVDGVACCADGCAKYEAPEPWRVPEAPRADVRNLAVVTCFFNPQHYRRPLANYHRFAKGIADVGLPLFTIELAFDGDSFQIPHGDQVTHVRGTRARGLMFQKERLLNQLVPKVPKEFDGIAWIDADVLFLNPAWADDALRQLSMRHVVQLHEICHDLTPQGQLTARPVSSGRMWALNPKQSNDFRTSHPGYAWAARADLLRRHGLFDQMITGGGDVNCVEGFTGVQGIAEGMGNPFAPGYSAACRDWAARMYGEVNGAMGCVAGSILHLFHGTQQNRRYGDRWALLAEYQFDPATDIELDAAGLWAWTDYAAQTKPELIRKIAECFASRREDD